MTTRPRVIALGQAVAGDDGVGFSVLRELRRRGAESRAVLAQAADATDLFSFFWTGDPVIVVDAAIGIPVGEVMTLTAADLAVRRPQTVSCHGLRVEDVVHLARALASPRELSPLHLVVVGIAPPPRYASGLSDPVAAAIPRAAEAVLALL